MRETYSIGIDFGTDSVRALVVHTQTGEVVGSAVAEYPRWAKKMYCNATESQYRQHPLDYTESLTAAVNEALDLAGDQVRPKVVGIGVDTTGSTPIAVNQQGIALSLLPAFEDNPNAMFILWKDHTSLKEAALINTVAATFENNYLKYVGGIYSAEWFWAKILHTIKVDPDVRAHAYTWIEHCDWISAELTGIHDPNLVKRSRCAAGHKALWNEEIGGLPPDAFFTAIDPLLHGMRDRIPKYCYPSNEPMGRLSASWANVLGLGTDVVVSVGAFDCHMGAVGAQISAYEFVRVMGTSTCDIMVSSKSDLGDTLVRGICGQVDGSVLPDMIGLEAGQSAFGDYYAWFQNIIIEPLKSLIDDQSVDELYAKLIPHLAEQASKLPITTYDPVASDWINGRRTPDADHSLKATITGVSLGTNTYALFKSIVEATAYGSRAIIERFKQEGIRIDRVIAIGGVAKKSPYAMQVLTDIINLPIKVAASDQACALGAAMFGAVVGRAHASISQAQHAMGSGYDVEYRPRPEYVPTYEEQYQKYLKLSKM